MDPKDRITRLRYCFGRVFFTTHWHKGLIFWAYLKDDLTLDTLNQIDTLNDEENGAYRQFPQHDEPFFLDSLLGI